MFSIVSMQDVLINLNGGETLFKMFDRPRTRKKSTSSKTLSVQSTFPMKKVWVLPSHIITMVTSGNIEEILSHDQVPKLGHNKNEQFKLIENETSGVFDLFQTVESEEFVFILLRTGKVVVWRFQRPEFEWKKVKEYSLCKGKDSQIVSYVYDKSLKLLVWCEKRSATQFCICKVNLSFSACNVTFEETKAVLHNCLPMNIYSLSKGHFIFIPISNKSLGLFLLWFQQTEKVTVRMWGDEFNDHSYIATTSDYQTIVRDCLYLWINRTNFENKIISQTTHPTSKELMILQNDLNVYTIRASRDGTSVESKLLCVLEEFPEGGEEFSKKIVTCYPIQRMLVLLMADGTINIFENQGGLFLWKTQTFRGGGPKIWIRQGTYPTAGIWNRSGIWNLRPKPIAEQLKEIMIKQNLVSEESSSEQSGNFLPTDKLADPEFALDVFEEQKKRPKTRKLKIKQGVNRSEQIPIGSIFSILSLWRLDNVSAETALSLAVKLNDLKTSDEEPDLSEVFCLIDVIKDPVLLLILFANKNFPFSVKKKLSMRLRTLMESPNIRKLDPEILSLLKQYIAADNQIIEFYTDSQTNSPQTEKTLVHENLIMYELNKLEKFISQPHFTTSSFDHSLSNIISLDEKQCIMFIVWPLIGKEKCNGTPFEGHGETLEFSDRVVLEIWKSLFRHDSKLFSRFFSYLWTTAPNIIEYVIEASQIFAADKANELFPIVFKLDEYVGRLLNILFLPSPEHPMHKEKIELCNKLWKFSTKEDIFDVFLEHDLFDEAFECLEKEAKGSENHSSKFFQMLLYLLNNKMFGQYAERISRLMPNNFKMAEFCNIYEPQAIEIGRGPVFVTNPRDVSVKDVKYFLEQLL